MCVTFENVINPVLDPIVADKWCRFFLSFYKFYYVLLLLVVFISKRLNM